MQKETRSLYRACKEIVEEYQHNRLYTTFSRIPVQTVRHHYKNITIEPDIAKTYVTVYDGMNDRERALIKEIPPSKALHIAWRLHHKKKKK